MGSNVNTEDLAKTWSFGTIDLEKDQKRSERMSDEARDLLGNFDAPVLDDEQRRRDLERRLAQQEKTGRESTMLTGGGSQLG